MFATEKQVDDKMEQTKKLYDLDSYSTEFSAKVLTCSACEDEEGRYAIVLDQTLFFPEEGGQSPDKGNLDGANVLDVQIKDEMITHYVDMPFEVGSEVHGTVNWKHRFYNMQQHSGEHIFSGIVHKRFGYDNVGFHLSDQIVTMDFNGILSEQDVLDVEYAVNEVIAKNVPITVSFPSDEELKKLDYRSKKELEGPIRIVTVEGYDICACCAPHVKRTGEIGMLKVMHVQNYKGGVRIVFLCGFRALEAFNEKNSIVDALVNMMSTNQENIADNIIKLKDELQTVKGKLAAANKQLLEIELNELDPNLTDVILFKEQIEPRMLREIVNQLMERYSGICAVFSGDDESGYQYVIGSQTLDCKVIAEKMKNELFARGGGSNRMIQGSVVTEATKIRDCIAK